MKVPETLWRIVEAPQFFRMCFRVGPIVRRHTAGFLKMTGGRS